MKHFNALSFHIVWQNDGLFGGGIGRFGLEVWVNLGKVVLVVLGCLFSVVLVVWVD